MNGVYIGRPRKLGRCGERRPVLSPTWEADALSSSFSVEIDLRAPTRPAHRPEIQVLLLTQVDLKGAVDTPDLEIRGVGRHSGLEVPVVDLMQTDLIAALDRGVNVYIGFGWENASGSTDEDPRQEDAVRRLEEIDGGGAHGGRIVGAFATTRSSSFAMTHT